MSDLQQKEQRLLQLLQSFTRPMLAFSGGVDSSLLLAACVKAGVLTEVIMADTPLVPEFEKEDAREISSAFNVKLHILQLDPLTMPQFCANDAQRCYICKKMLFTQIKAYAEQLGYGCLLDGANADDSGDYRPGMQASKELGVRSPLLECGFTKADVRALAAQYGLAVASKPAYACLASRIAYQEPVTYAKLRRVEQAEAVLRELAFTDVRVRCHGDLARIEVQAQQILQAAEQRTVILEKLQQLGFTYVTLDLAGFSSGSMNKLIGK